MLKYIVRRLIGAIPVLFGLSIVLFAFVRLLPGDPAIAILGQHATPELIKQVNETLGFDRPIYVQYVDYLWKLFHGDFGASIINGRPVLSEFAVRFPGTVELTVAALIFAVGIGIPLGRLAARHPNGWIDGIVTVISLVGISIPIFVLGYTLVFFFGVQLQWLPAFGQIDPRLDVPTVTNFVLIDAIISGNPDAVLDALAHLVLPAIALGSIPLAIITRITRASVLDVANEDYVRTARAKGLTERRVDGRHIMRNAWLPVTTIIGLQVGGLLAGAVITETVFTWNGVGSWVVNAIQDHDYFVVQSTVLIFALIFLVVNLIVDIGYAFLNPRIRYG
ncbi:MAG TPA: ABC transporter permease [Candidatus Limnocylindrales bacterium]|nr:ABC transporter permease [Candidatus Limnocylindrales bacterium]